MRPLLDEFLGAGVGAAMAGLRPVVEIMLIDFLGVAIDSLCPRRVLGVRCPRSGARPTSARPSLGARGLRWRSS